MSIQNSYSPSGGGHDMQENLFVVVAVLRSNTGLLYSIYRKPTSICAINYNTSLTNWHKAFSWKRFDKWNGHSSYKCGETKKILSRNQRHAIGKLRCRLQSVQTMKTPSTEAKNQTKKGGMLLLLMSVKRHFLTTIFRDAEIRIVYVTNNAIRKHKEFKIQTVCET